MLREGEKYLLAGLAFFLVREAFFSVLALIFQASFTATRPALHVKVPLRVARGLYHLNTFPLLSCFHNKK
jgi:hypothetical protein